MDEDRRFKTRKVTLVVAFAVALLGVVLVLVDFFQGEGFNGTGGGLIAVGFAVAAAVWNERGAG